jgi:membrane-associated HD superfamily phosphohydrolase
VANQTTHLLVRKLRPIYLTLEYILYKFCYFAKNHIEDILASKPKLFLTVSLSTFAVFTPLIIVPHLNRPVLIYFISMHVASIVISVFLIVVSILAYKRTRSKKVLYTTVGFLSLLVVELLFLLQVMPGTSRVMHRGIYLGLPHILLLLMLTLFGVGVLKVEK